MYPLHTNGRDKSSYALMKIQGLLFSVLLLSGFDHCHAAVSEVQAMNCSISPTFTTLSLTWLDPVNRNFIDLNYQISYNVSVGSVTLFSEPMTSYNATDILDNSTTSLYAIDLMNEVYFIDGVMVSVSVQAVNGSEVGPEVVTMCNASGVFAPPVLDLQAVVSDTVPAVNLTWTIPFTQIPPISYSLTYTATNLFESSLTFAEGTTMSMFLDNETSLSDGDGNRLLSLTELRFYSSYTFELIATYADGDSIADSAFVNSTVEGVPSVVQNLIVSINSTDIMIMWQAPEMINGIISYVVDVDERDLLTNDITPIVASMTVTVLKLNVSDVVNAYSQYTVSVTSRTGAGNGATATVNSTSPQEAPSAPRNVTTVEIASTYAVFEWSIPEFPNGVIQRYIVSLTSVRDNTVTTVNSLELTANVTGLSPFIIYRVEVSAETVEIGEGSSSFTITTRQDIPSPARNVEADFNDTYIMVMWGAPAMLNGLVNYSIEIQRTDLLTNEMIVVFAMNTSELFIIFEHNVKDFSQYNISVTSLTIIGEGDAAMTSFETPEGVPTSAQNLAIMYNQSYIFITWTAPAYPNGFVNYTVEIEEIDLLDTLDSVRLIDEPAVTTELELLVNYDVKPYHQYNVTVTSQTSAGMGEPVMESFVTPEIAPSPARGVTVSVNASQELIVITWLAPAFPNGVVNYTVQVEERVLIFDTLTTIATEVVNEPSLSLNFTVQPYTEYIATVTAQTSAGEGNSAMGSLTTPEETPTDVQNLTISYSSRMDSSLIIVWEDSANPNGNVTYFISVTCFDLATNMTLYDDVFSVLFGEDNRLEIDFIESFAKCTAAAIASNSAGNSSVVTDQFTTPQGVATPPENLTTTTTNISVSVVWAAPNDANGIIFAYLVTLFDSAGSEVNSTRISNLTMLQAMFIDLSPYTNYSIRVNALTGTSGGSEIPGEVAEEFFMTDIGIPTAPNNVLLLALQIRSFTVSWIPPDVFNAPTVTYRIMYTPLGAENATFLMSEFIVNTTLVLDELLPFTDYSVAVQACSSVGCGPFSMETTNRTLEEAPSMPLNVMAVPVNSTTISIMWDPPEFLNGLIRHYIVNYSSTGVFGGRGTLMTSDNSTSLLIGSLIPFTEYTITVVGVTNSEGPPSELEIVQTNESAPTAGPQQLMGSDITPRSITITWDPPPLNMTNGMIRSYIVRYFPSRNASEEPNDEQSIPGNMTSFMIADLDPFISYTFEVLAVTVDSGPSASITIMTEEAAPSAPEIIEAVSTNSTSISVTWTPPLFPNGNILRYFVSYLATTVPMSGPPVEISIDATVTTTELTGLMTFTTYNISVAAETVQRGDPSDTVTVTTDEDRPSQPLSVEAIEINSTAVQVTWSRPMPANGIITHYFVNYTAIFETDNMTVMEAEEMSMRIDANDIQMTYVIELVNLTEFTTYRIEVSASTHIGEGDSREVVVITDPAMASPPTSLIAEALNSTSILLSWGYPLFPRGEIRGYIIRYDGGMGMEDLEINETLDSLDNRSNQSIVIDMLQPFVNYTFRVAAYAIHEGGDIIGAFAEVTEQTLEAAPLAPRFFNVSTVSGMPSQLQASWMAPQRANGRITFYTVFCRENDTMDDFTTTSSMDASMTSLIIDSLSPFTFYECFVTANTSAGQSEPSNTDTARTDEDAPNQPPQNLNGSFINSTSIQLSWSAPPEDGQNGFIRKYIIRYFQDGDSSSVMMFETSDLEIVIAGLNKYTLYQVEVSAVTVAEGPAASVSVRTDSDVPSQPLNVMIPPANLSARSLVVSWSPPSDFNAPEITYFVQLTSVSLSMNVSDIAIETRTFMNLLPFTEYTVVVFAVSDKGAGPGSEPATVTTDQDLPMEPGNFTLETVRENPMQLTATWSPPSPANGIVTNYTIRCTSSVLAPEGFVIMVGNVLSETLDNLVPFTVYSCNVSATTGAGEGPSTGIQMARTNESVPDAPEMFAAMDRQAQNISFSWMPPNITRGNLTGYNLTYFNETHRLSVPGPLDENTLQATVTELNEFTFYSFELRASTSAGFGEAAVVNTTTAQAAPSASPLNLAGEFNDSQSLSISWTDPPVNDQNGIIVAYNITYRKIDDPDSAASTAVTNETSFVISGLKPFTNYTVQVAAITVAMGPYSDPVTIITDSATPSEPRNVTFTDRTRSSILITWLEPDPTNGRIERYLIEYTVLTDNIQDEATTSIPDLPADVLEYNITSLMEYVNYSIAVFAFTDKGRGEGSQPIVVRTLEHHPDEPTNFQVTVVNSTSLSATWGPPDDANGVIISYHLSVVLDPKDALYLPGDSSMEFNISATSRSYVLTNLHEFATYSLSLAAATTVGIGNYTEPQSNTTLMAAPSSGVQNISASVIRPTSMNLTWAPPPLRDWNGVLTNYNITYRPVLDCSQPDQNISYVEGGFVTLPADLADPKIAYNQSLISELLVDYTVTGLEEFFSYVFAVDVATVEGNSPIEEQCFKTSPSVPEAPTISEFTISSNTSALVSWEPLSPADHNGILDEYTVTVTNTNTTMSINYTVPSNVTSHILNDLTPYTDYSVKVAASNQAGVGPFSRLLMNRTNEGVPEAPRGLKVTAVNITTIDLVWEPPAIPYGVLEFYYISYVAVEIGTEKISRATTDTTIRLTDLNGDNTYTIEVMASTSAGNGSVASIPAKTLRGTSPVIEYENIPEIQPVAQTDENGEPSGVTSTSFAIAFKIVPEQEVNGMVDKYWIIVQRQPSSNANLLTYYDSNLATSEWPQYAAVEKIRERSTSGRKRQAEGTTEMVTVGGTQECGPNVSPCNGPLEPESDYRVRYRLFSGNQSVDYDFTSDVFTTAKATSSILPIIVAVVVSLVVLVILVIIVIILAVVYVKKRKSKGEFKVSKYKNGRNGDQILLPRNESGSTIPFLGPSDPGIVPIHEMKEGGTPLRASEPRFPKHIQNTKIYLKEFSEHLKSMLDDSNYKFSEEYERVTEIGLEHAKEASLMAENRAKNRYTNILAYDHSRVKLSFVDDEPGSDYINASYIPGHRMRRAYIATQGPLPATFDDFWRMVWEQNTHMIVMLTQLVERGRTKCHRYWPGTEPSVYGDIAVEMISEKEKEDWTIREFKLNVPDRRSRLVRHYQFTSWPDHGVPDSPSAALDFVKTVRSQVEPHHGPIVVHCSAGVGRTGCFIALDTLQQNVRDHDWVDIYGLACEMRQHRNHMIQTEAQYVFIHKSMQEIIDTVSTYGTGMGTGALTMTTSHFPNAGYSSVYCNPFADEASATQMSDYYNDYLSEETHM